jgi:hypothetical protein
MEPGIAIDVSVVLRYGDEAGVPLDYVNVALNALDAVAYAQELEDFKVVRRHVDELDIPPVVMDAVESRLRAHKGQSLLRVQSVSQGSLELTVSLGGLFIWLLDKTLGETIKQAWTQTLLHEKLKELLMRRREQKAKELGIKTSQRINRKLGPDAGAHVVLVDPVGGPGHHRYAIKIEIDITSLPEYPPPREMLFVGPSGA